MTTWTSSSISDRCNLTRPGYQQFPPRCNRPVGHDGPHQTINHALPMWPYSPERNPVQEEWANDSD